MIGCYQNEARRARIEEANRICQLYLEKHPQKSKDTQLLMQDFSRLLMREMLVSEMTARSYIFALGLVR